MSHFDYTLSRALAIADYPFAALIMAAMRKADTENTKRLRIAFPEIGNELLERYNAPGGIIDGDSQEDARRANT